LRRFFTGLVVILTMIALAAIFYISLYEQEPRLQKKAAPPERKARHHREAATQKEPRQKPEKGSPIQGRQPPAPPLTPRGQEVAIIIDDIGNDLKPLHELLKLDAPISVAVLPYCAHSVEAAETLHRTGRDILLHLPMEPQSYPGENPGRGALFVSMGDDEIRQRLEEDLKAVPHVSGINNHMGSRFMEDDAKLTVALRLIREKGLFFIDSRTTQNSRARPLARKMGVPFKSRDVFIDNTRNYKETLRILTEIPSESRKRGAVLMIGHPYPETLAALRDAIPVLKARGVQIVPASALLGTAAAGHRPDFQSAVPVPITRDDHLTRRK
jgi:polysaccharide deacetylase 2 family uncharacterized protein YibQ